MDIRVSRDTVIRMVSAMGAEHDIMLHEMGRSRGDKVRYFMEIDEKTVQRAIVQYQEDELKAERDLLRARIREIDEVLGDY